MGVLREKVRKAFKKYKEGDIKAFAQLLVDAGDVGCQYHRDIVDDEVLKQLEKMG